MTLEQYKIETLKASNKQDLYEIAGQLNNRPEHVNVDKVTFMAFLDLEESRQYVLKIIEKSTQVLNK